MLVELAIRYKAYRSAKASMQINEIFDVAAYGIILIGGIMLIIAASLYATRNYPTGYILFLVGYSLLFLGFAVKLTGDLYYGTKIHSDSARVRLYAESVVQEPVSATRVS